MHAVFIEDWTPPRDYGVPGGGKGKMDIDWLDGYTLRQKIGRVVKFPGNVP